MRRTILILLFALITYSISSAELLFRIMGLCISAPGHENAKVVAYGF